MGFSAHDAQPLRLRGGGGGGERGGLFQSRYPPPNFRVTDHTPPKSNVLDTEFSTKVIKIPAKLPIE